MVEPAKKPRGNPKWKPGQSGNPSGRPKDQFGELIRSGTDNGRLLVEKAMALLMSSNEDIQIKALNWLSDRGWGKAIQPIGVDAEANRIIVEFKS